MNTKFFRIVLPACAFMLAIALSSFTNSINDRPGWIESPQGPMPTPVLHCNVEASDVDCEWRGKTVYLDSAFTIPLKKIMP